MPKTQQLETRHGDCATCKKELAHYLSVMAEKNRRSSRLRIKKTILLECKVHGNGAATRVQNVIMENLIKVLSD